MNRELAVRITLERPPSGIDFGVQKGSGHTYETILLQKSGEGNLSFAFTIVLKKNKAGLPDFAGLCVQGPPNERFIYIGIGKAAGEVNSVWSRRLKVPLSGISPEMIEQLLADSSLILETSVPGTGKDGGPNCATVKPFPGWKLSRS